MSHRSPTPTQRPMHTVFWCHREQSVRLIPSQPNNSLARHRVAFRLTIPPFASSFYAATSRSHLRDAISRCMRLPWRPTQYRKHPSSAARPRILRAGLRIAWARRPRAIIASLPLNEVPVCYVAALGPPGFGRMLQLQSGLSFAYARSRFRCPCYRSYPSRAPARAFAVIRPSFILGFCKFVLRAPLVVSIRPFSALATRNHPTTPLTTVIHLFSPLSRAGSPS
ncbi:hypothetical protein B0H13DRAFT_2672876 [Mycena leptocephala]|nr:hypothetical protein B0H13DRAFT_2672876 [Mycena leptocephala]